MWTWVVAVSSSQLRRSDVSLPSSLSAHLSLARLFSGSLVLSEAIISLVSKLLSAGMGCVRWELHLDLYYECTWEVNCEF